MLLDGFGIAQTANLQTTDRLLLPIKKRIFIRLQVPKGCCAASAGLLSRGCLECLRSKDEVGNSLEDYLTPMLSLRLFDAHLLGAVCARNESELVSGDLLQAVGCSRHGIHSDHLPQVLVLQLRRGLEQLGVDSGEGSLLFAGSSRVVLFCNSCLKQVGCRSLTGPQLLVARPRLHLDRRVVEKLSLLQGHEVLAHCCQLVQLAIHLVEIADAQIQLLLGLPQRVVGLAQTHEPRPCRTALSSRGCSTALRSHLPSLFLELVKDGRQVLEGLAVSAHLPYKFRVEAP